MNYKQELSNLLEPLLNIENIYNQIEIPERKMGDFAFPCFRLARELKKAPPAIASEIAEKINASLPDWLEKATPTGPYINFFIKKSKLANTVISQAIVQGENFGKSNIGTGKTIVIDYSSPNIAKPFHVGHLRSTVIGQALYNIYEHLGYNCIGVNHLGDWGTQFGKLIAAYKMWSSKEEIETGGIPALNSIYVKFHDQAKEDPSLEDQGRNYLLKMEQGDEEALSIWSFFNHISLKEFERVYKRLDIKFDHYTGESFYQDKMQPVLDELDKKGLLQESQGAKIVDLESFDLPPCLVLRADGGTLYHTRDLATAFYRKQTFDFHKVLYVTAIDQSLHFNQLFRVIQKMGYQWSDDMHHVPFGLVSLESGKLSTRSGNVVLMEDLLNSAVSKATEIINEKNPELADKENVAEAVGIGAIIFNDLYNQRIKDITFSLEKMLNFDGETGPFVQYAHARAVSLLKKGGDIDITNINYSSLTDEESQNLLYHLYFFNEKLIEATEKLEPYIVTRHVTQTAQAFNKFYQVHKIIDSPQKNERLALVLATKNMLKTGLKLIGIAAPDRM